WQNLGFGNRARVNEGRGLNRLSMLELFRIQDQVAADIVQAYFLARSAAERVKQAENEIKDALEVARENIKNVGQTKRTSGNLIVLLIRPQEAVASVEALVQAYNDYYGAVADYNRAQFRLYRALGHPAQLLTNGGLPCQPE